MGNHVVERLEALKESLRPLAKALDNAGRLAHIGELHSASGWAQEALRLAEASRLFHDAAMSLLRAAEALVRRVTTDDLVYGKGVYKLPWAGEVFYRAAEVVDKAGNEDAMLYALVRLMAMAAGEEAYRRGHCW